ncbi:hypothetical protein A9Z06_14855 [Rhizobium sp. YK2]|nr:hypothetical protein A9Z06_14855 [Rhizobium sp. YK2]
MYAISQRDQDVMEMLRQSVKVALLFSAASFGGPQIFRHDFSSAMTSPCLTSAIANFRIRIILKL